MRRRAFRRNRSIRRGLKSSISHTPYTSSTTTDPEDDDLYDDDMDNLENL